jgi:hypothetical protein
LHLLKLHDRLQQYVLRDLLVRSRLEVELALDEIDSNLLGRHQEESIELTLYAVVQTFSHQETSRTTENHAREELGFCRGHILLAIHTGETHVTSPFALIDLMMRVGMINAAPL